MWIPQWAEYPQSSFVEAVAPPGVEPGAAPLVCLEINATWLPYLLGAMMQLINPATWATDDPTVLQTTIDQVNGIMAAFAAAGECTTVQFRFTDTCGLQYSVDGGTTWLDVPGWSTYAPDCFTGPAGPAGPPFVGQGTAPPNPTGGTAAVQACNIASYLAASIVEASLGQAVSGVNDGKTVADTVAGIVALLGGFDPIVDLIVGAGIVAVNYIAAQTTAPYETALADPTFLSDVQCAIYSAIASVGYVTSGNFAAVLTNIAAISYTSADVVTTVHDFVEALGLTGLQMMQVSGSLYAGDCSACIIPPGCEVPTAVVVAAIVSWTPGGPNAGKMLKGADTGAYAGVTWEAPSDESIPFSLKATPHSNYGAIGFYAGSLADGGPEAGDNNWVNSVGIVLIGYSGGWAVLLNGVETLSGGSALPSTLEVHIDPGTLLATCIVDGTTVFTGPAEAVTYLPVAYLNTVGDELWNVLLCQ